MLVGCVFRGRYCKVGFNGCSGSALYANCSFNRARIVNAATISDLVQGVGGAALTSHSSGPADAGRLTPALCVTPELDCRIRRVCAQAEIFSFNAARLFIVVVNSTGVFIAACRSRLGALGAPCQLQLQTTGTRLGTKRILIAGLWVPLQEQRRAFQPSGWVHSSGRGWAVKRYTQQVIQADTADAAPLNSSVMQNREVQNPKAKPYWLVQGFVGFSFVAFSSGWIFQWVVFKAGKRWR